MSKFSTTIPLRLESVANIREHWSGKAKRTKAHRQAAIALMMRGVTLPCVVEIIRIGPKPLDTDNLLSACKGLRDGIADRLGVDDADERVTWRYGQERGEYGVRVKFECDTAPEMVDLKC